LNPRGTFWAPIRFRVGRLRPGSATPPRQVSQPFDSASCSPRPRACLCNAADSRTVRKSTLVATRREAQVCQRLLDDLIQLQQHRPRDRQSERPRRPEIDDELELGRLFDGQIGGFGALQDLVDERCGVPIVVGVVDSLASEAYHELPRCIHRRQSVLCRKVDDERRIRQGEGLEPHHERGRALSDGRIAAHRRSATSASVSRAHRPSLQHGVTPQPTPCPPRRPVATPTC
jgi:hypothetical protein